MLKTSAQSTLVKKKHNKKQLITHQKNKLKKLCCFKRIKFSDLPVLASKIAMILRLSIAVTLAAHKFFAVI